MRRIVELSLPLKSKIFFIILLVCIEALSFERAFSQSHVSNGDFELLNDCPKFWSEKAKDFKVVNWYSPNKSTPDYFAPCSQQCNNSINWISSVDVKGKGNYVGVVLYRKDTEKYREYIQTKLIEDLIKGQFYSVRMKVYWPDKSSYVPEHINCLLSTIDIHSKSESKINSDKYLKPLGGQKVGEKSNWVELEFEFIASGSEKYLTIGDFSTSKVQKVTGEFPFSYVFIDDVSLVKKVYTYENQYVGRMPNVISRVELLDNDTLPGHQPENCSCFTCKIINGEVASTVDKIDDVIGTDLEKGQRIDLNRIIFDYKTGEMTSESKAELYKMEVLLNSQPNAKIQIVVFTYEGKEDAKDLTKKTSLDIYHYLRNRGVKNSFSFLHATTDNLQAEDGINRDRKIEMLIVKNTQ
ncbi:MAG: hypothetical protein ACI8Q1_001408 [Parvicella sp.]|jgi:hypothetical protein